MSGDHETRPSPSWRREMEDGFRNDTEAHRLLGLINAEFQSDPMSVQCFDLRVVEQVKLCVAKRTAFVKRNPVYGD